MAPETFKQIVEGQQATLTTGPGGPLLAMGATEQGEQVAVLRGRREEDDVAQFLVVTARNTHPKDQETTTEIIPVGSRSVYHPSVEDGLRSSWYIKLGDERAIRFPSEKAKAGGALVHIGNAAIRAEVTPPARTHQRTRQRTRRVSKAV